MVAWKVTRPCHPACVHRRASSRCGPYPGELTAQRMINNRSHAKKGPLKSMKLLTDQEYDRIRDRIIARQPPKKK